MNNKLIDVDDNGLFSPAGGFYIDPWRGVDKALITHAHSDHARYGSRYYLASPETVEIMELRQDSQLLGFLEAK